MAAPTEYRSTDASAPVLTGESSKLVALLKAILVDGYGAKPAAGWTRPYSSGTDYAAFRQGGGLQHYFAVNDTNAQMTRVKGYKTMSDFISGTGDFPTEAQFSGGLYVRKSIAANTTARPWIAWATNQTLYLFIFGGSTVLTTYGGGDSHFGFGQVVAPTMPGDANHSFIMAASDTSVSSTAASVQRQILSAFGISPLAGHYMPAAYTQAGSSIAIGKRPATVYAQTVSGVGGVTFPDPITGDLNLHRISLMESGLLERGDLPGLWNIGHASITSFGQFDTASGDGTLAGRAFTIVNTASGGVAIETTDGSW